MTQIKSNTNHSSSTSETQMFTCYSWIFLWRQCCWVNIDAWTSPAKIQSGKAAKWQTQTLYTVYTHLPEWHFTRVQKGYLKSDLSDLKHFCLCENHNNAKYFKKIFFFYKSRKGKLRIKKDFCHIPIFNR